MTTKRTTTRSKLDTFTVRIPDTFTRGADGTPVWASWHEVSNRTDKGDDTRLTPDEQSAFSDVMMDRTVVWTKETADSSRLIKRGADLYVWWQNYIDGPLSHVPIGSEEFRQSRAGLIHHTFMNLLRRKANLSPVDFKALSLAEVFCVIEDAHVKAHNAKNAAKRSAGDESQYTSASNKRTIVRSETDDSPKVERSRKPWTGVGPALADKYIEACETKREELPLEPWVRKFLADKVETAKWKCSASTEIRRLRDNKDQWYPLLQAAIRTD